ncbi:hypothetical protein BJ138DRAFT_1106403 [Hygrophoropsis aurantiaca]|uniref:Uncharacterized protein n=1 Tax=Hygrophoropsis aurantiaca TaxID=72124 RepID=A0ACB7ZV49_9AGAM|nr:hypothetical protein BJ138DRAFT_1106403 [Hygrophoropsis aurantiaca]
MSRSTSKSLCTDSTDSLDILIASLSLEEARGDFSRSSADEDSNRSLPSILTSPPRVFTLKPSTSQSEKHGFAKGNRSKQEGGRNETARVKDEGTMPLVNGENSPAISWVMLIVRRVSTGVQTASLLDKQYIVSSGTKTGTMQEWYEAGHATQGVPGGKVNKTAAEVTPAQSKHPLVKKKQKYAAWVVVKGREPGVYYSWRSAEEQVVGFPNNSHQGYKTIDEAHQVWARHNERSDLPRDGPSTSGVMHSMRTAASAQKAGPSNVNKTPWYLRPPTKQCRWIVVFKGIEPGIYPDCSSMGGRCRDPPVAFFSGPSTSQVHRDTAVYLSVDGRRATNANIQQAFKKRRLEPEELDDVLATWTPGGEYAPHSDEGGAPEAELDGDVIEVQPLKRKRYINSDQPMNTWRPYAAEFLNELVRHEGLGNGATCSGCSTDNDGKSTTLYRCKDCFGGAPECHKCCLARHSYLPLHTITQWVGFWQNTSLNALGLSVQLGHSGLHSCPLPSAPVNLVVLDSNGIHIVSTRFCECPHAMNASKRVQLLRLSWFPATLADPQTCATFRVLEHYHQLNLNGGLNVQDFMNTLERQTDASGLQPIPDRYKAFSRIFRQWTFLKQMKRAGRAHECTGPAGTKPGECAILCWACPHDGINLPTNWRDVDPKHLFLYALVLAMDANFRLKSRLRAVHPDPALCPGSAYLVDEKPYLAHLKNYVAESDISTCIAFAALTQKETRITTGLRSSGVGACICARHEVVRPRGVGDLQKGERYSNMDYIFLSAICGVALATIILSYDISCQYKKNFHARVEKMPNALRITPDKTDINFALPSWHALAHKSECQVENSIAYLPGAGRTDGEGIERSWAEMNPLASSTKEMGPGARHDALDDHFGFHNWEKNIHLGDMLSRRLIVAIAERERQVNNFREVTDTLSVAVVKEWKGMLKSWEKDKSQPNPYEIDRKGEQRLRVEAENINHTVNQASVLEDKRIACLNKLRGFRDLQRLYMPGAVCCIQREDDSRDREALPPNVENIKLWLPSDLPPSDRLSGCVKDLPDMERKLREAQCHDALDALRARLHAKAYLITFRNKNMRGQVQSTRSRTLIARIGDRANFCAQKYRHARSALIRLSGQEFDGHTFKELLPTDLTLDCEDGADVQSQQALARAGKDTGPRTKKKSNGRKILSWIWTAGGGPDEEQESGVHQSVRVEWCKARARKLRWSEEVDLLREEMRRALCFLEWRERWWLLRPTAWEGLDPSITAGLVAYARRQAVLHRDLASAFEAKWSQPSVAAARALIGSGGGETEDDVALGETFLGSDG